MEGDRSWSIRSAKRRASAASPASTSMLTALATRPGVHQSVLTGNLREVARIKLEVFGLDRHLDLAAGAYGDDDPDRAKLVAIAQRRATQRTGVVFDGDATVLIGDTPNDVAAGLAAGVRVIGVATGRSDADELRSAGAPEVAASLAECRVILLRWAELR
jgi:phosphoglycolate phosphatase